MRRTNALLALVCLCAACGGVDSSEGDGSDASAGATGDGGFDDGGASDDADNDGGETSAGSAVDETDSGGSDAAATGDDGEADDDGDDGVDPPPPPTLTWLTYEYTCPPDADGLQPAAAGVPTDFGATSYIYSADGGTWFINGGGGSESGIAGDNTFEVACGSGNNHGAGTTVRAAVGVAPGASQTGNPLRWETYDVVCPDVNEAWVAAEDVEPGFVAATYAAQQPGEDRWYINPSGGWSSHVLGTDGTLRILCGDQNSHDPGTRVRVALGYADAPLTETLDWELHEYTCPAGDGLFEAATGIDPDFAAVTYLASYDGAAWDLQTLSGLSTELTGDGRLMIACGSGNGHNEATIVRVGLGYG